MGWGIRKIWRCPKCKRSGQEYYSHHDNWHCELDGTKKVLEESFDGDGNWMSKWHDFIDHLAIGQTEDSFFAEF